MHVLTRYDDRGAPDRAMTNVRNSNWMRWRIGNGNGNDRQRPFLPLSATVRHFTHSHIRVAFKSSCSSSQSWLLNLFNITQINAQTPIYQHYTRKQESRAVARKSRDFVCYLPLFHLEFQTDLFATPRRRS